MFYITQHEYHLAMNTLLQSIKYVIPVYGSDNEYIPMIILLTSIAQAHIGLKNLAGAEISLDGAIVRLKKLEDIGKPRSINLTRAMVHRTQGTLFFAKKFYTDAIIEFSEFIYFVTEELGPKHFRTCYGYYSLAKCFLAKGQYVRGMAMINFSVDICLDYLFQLIKSVIPDPNFCTTKWERSHLLSRYYEIESIELLRGVLKIVNDYGDNVTEGKIIVCESMLLFLRKHNTEARRHLNLLGQIHDVENDAKLNMISKFIKQACYTEENQFVLR